LNVFRGEILHFVADPIKVGIDKCYQYFADGVLITENGYIKAVGHSQALLETLPPKQNITHYKQGLIVPGFVDTHIHYPQTEMIASYGEQLLEWLENYTYPVEEKFANYQYAKEIAEFFLAQLLQAGTTTALVFGTVHKSSVEAFFTVAQQKNLRMICGKVLMDQNCPESLQDTPEIAYHESKTLIEKWHNQDRLQYAVTPRFAPTCSREQLNKAGQLLAEYPSVYLHTHLCESQAEIAWVKTLFPQSNGYLDVYDQSNLLSRRSVFAHGVHLAESECVRLAQTQSGIAFCPSSNLFLGSGLFNLKQIEQHHINIGLGTDVGAGTSFSLLKTMNEAYKTQQLRGDKLDPFKAFYLATLGGATTLDLQDKIGNFLPGKEADFIVINYQGSELLAKRISHSKNLAEKLFALSMLADERHICATYIMGELAKI
jgi:guanine deaminase